MKKAIWNKKKIVMIALALALISAPFISNSIKADEAVVFEIDDATVKQLENTLVTLRENLETFFNTIKGFISKEQDKKMNNIPAVEKKLRPLERELRQLAASLPAEVPFIGIKNLANHIANTENKLYNAFKAKKNKALEFIKAVDYLSGEAHSALHNELHGNNGLFEQLRLMRNLSVLQSLINITLLIDDLIQMKEFKALGYNSHEEMGITINSRMGGKTPQLQEIYAWLNAHPHIKTRQPQKLTPSQ